MRITGGELRGQEISFPKSDKTRPLTDRGRSGLFSALGDVSDLKMIDAYAGSGAVGLDAISRGVKHVIGIEKYYAIAQNLSKNIQKLQCKDKYSLEQMTVEKWARVNTEKHGDFDLIFAGPPFEQLSVSELNLLVPYLRKGGMLVVEHYKKLPISELTGAVHLDNRQFGESVLSFYRKQ